MITAIKTYRKILLSLLCGTAYCACFPDTNLYFLAWIALIPLLFVILKVNPFQAFWYGMVAGFTAYSGLMYWIYPTVFAATKSIPQSIICVVLLCLYLSLYFGLWAFLLRLVNPVSSLFRFSLYAAVLWVSLEYARTYLFTGFPWVLLGYSQYKALSIIQIAEYTGVYGVSFLIVWVNVGIYKFIKTRRYVPFIGLMVLLAAIVLISMAKLSNYYYSAPPYIRVAVLQTNIDQYKKWDIAYEKEIISSIESLITKASAEKPDVILWPETSVPGYLPSNAYLFSWVTGLVLNSNTYHIVGAPYYNGGSEYYNSVLLFSPEGEVLKWHKKTHLVPFGEFIPFRSIVGKYFTATNEMGDFTKSNTLAPLSVKSVMWGTTICSENMFGNIAGDLTKAGAGVLANFTNDAWFFDTSAAMQHFTMNVFRAIENRRPVIVCGNTGVSGLVESSGRITKTIPVFSKSYFIAGISPRSVMTFYAKHGDVFAQACIIVFLFMLLSYAFHRIKTYRGLRAGITANKNI